MKKWVQSLMRVPLRLLGPAASLELTAAVAYLLFNRTNGTIVSSGERRSYLLYVPRTYDPSTPTPLVISLHGYSEWPAHQMQMTHWNDLAGQYGFIVVYPSGTRFPKRWRAAGKRRSTPPRSWPGRWPHCTRPSVRIRRSWAMRSERCPGSEG